MWSAPHIFMHHFPVVHLFIITHTHTHTDTEDAARFFSLKRLSCDTWSEMKMVSKLIQPASSDLVYESKSIIHQEVVLKRKKKKTRERLEDDPFLESSYSMKRLPPPHDSGCFIHELHVYIFSGHGLDLTFALFIEVLRKSLSGLEVRPSCTSFEFSNESRRTRALCHRDI